MTNTFKNTRHRCPYGYSIRPAFRTPAHASPPDGPLPLNSMRLSKGSMQMMVASAADRRDRTMVTTGGSTLVSDVTKNTTNNS